MLHELVQVTQCYDNLYWERMEERKFTHRQDFRPPTSSPYSLDPQPPTTPFCTSQQPYPARQPNSTSQPPCPLHHFLDPNGTLNPNYPTYIPTNNPSFILDHST